MVGATMHDANTHLASAKVNTLRTLDGRSGVKGKFHVMARVAWYRHVMARVAWYRGSKCGFLSLLEAHAKIAKSGQRAHSKASTEGSIAENNFHAFP